MISVFDQTIYAKAFEVNYKVYEKFKLIVLRLGTFYIHGTLISIIGKRFLHAGLKELFIEARVVAEGCGLQFWRAETITGVFVCRNWLTKHSWGLHWLDGSHPAGSRQVQTCIDEIGTLADELSKERHDEVSRAEFSSILLTFFSEYTLHLRNTDGPLSLFRMSYIDMIELLLHLICASREGNWCFSYDTLNYARYMSAYYSDITSLPDEHPEVHKFVRNGGFSS